MVQEEELGGGGEERWKVPLLTFLEEDCLESIWQSCKTIISPAGGRVGERRGEGWETEGERDKARGKKKAEIRREERKTWYIIYIFFIVKENLEVSHRNLGLFTGSFYAICKYISTCERKPTLFWHF